MRAIHPETAKELADARDRQRAAEALAGNSEARIQELRAKFREGRYQVDAARVSAGIVDESIKSGPPTD